VSYRTTRESFDGRHGGPGRSRPGQILATILGFVIVLICVVCPWVMWGAWGPWLGLCGVVVGQLLYMALLKPPGICLGLSWIFTAVSGALALVSICLVLVLRCIR
jgi:hypothetical protein